MIFSKEIVLCLFNKYLPISCILYLVNSFGIGRANFDRNLYGNTIRDSLLISTDSDSNLWYN